MELNQVSYSLKDVYERGKSIVQFRLIDDIMLRKFILLNDFIKREGAVRLGLSDD